MAIPNPVDKFLQAVFGSDYETRAIFANAKYNPVTKKLETWQHFRDVRQLDDARDCFLSPAAFLDDGIAERTGARVVEVRALVIDDVGTPEVPAADVLKGLGPPTFEVLTSAGSAHWWYALTTPVPAAEWPDFFEETERLVKHDLDGAEAHHVFRVPIGVNTKAKHTGFRPCSGQVNPGVKIDPVAIMLFAPPRPVRASSGGGGGCHSYQDMVGLAALIPNPDSLLRKPWVDHGYWFRAAAIDDDAAWQGFLAWSQSNTYWYDGDDTEKLWRGLKPKDTSGRNLLLEAEAADPAGYAAWLSREAKAAFDDGVIHPEALKPKGITATPFKWVDLSKTNPRDWLYGDILLRKFISMTVAPGGTGKSTLVAVETLAQVTGKALLGDEPSGELRVWLWNLEDTYEETQKKILAAAKHYGISEEEIGDRLFVDSGRDQRLVMAEMAGSTPRPVRPVIGALVEQIRLRKIDIVVIDPFVSSHGVPENDNTAMDMVVKEWGRVAEEGNCAVHLVDHTSKAGSKEVVTDSSRGAKAKTDAARVVRVVNRMTDIDGKTYGIGDIWRYFNTFNDKANMAPPKSRRDWFRMESVRADNGANAAQAFSVGAAASRSQGDSIGVAVQWMPPSAQAQATGDSYTAVVKVMGAKRWQSSPRSPDWVGNAIAQALQISAASISGRASIKTIIKKWISEGLFKTSTQTDKYRNVKEYIEIAEVY